MTRKEAFDPRKAVPRAADVQEEVLICLDMPDEQSGFCSENVGQQPVHTRIVQPPFSTAPLATVAPAHVAFQPATTRLAPTAAAATESAIFACPFSPAPNKRTFAHKQAPFASFGACARSPDLIQFTPMPQAQPRPRADAKFPAQAAVNHAEPAADGPAPKRARTHSFKRATAAPPAPALSPAPAPPAPAMCGSITVLAADNSSRALTPKRRSARLSSGHLLKQDDADADADALPVAAVTGTAAPPAASAGVVRPVGVAACNRKRALPQRPAPSHAHAGHAAPVVPRKGSAPAHKPAQTVVQTATQTAAPVPLELSKADVGRAVAAAAETLRSVEEDWEKRTAALLSLPALLERAHAQSGLHAALERLSRPLCAQLADLRSSVVRTACDVLVAAAEGCGPALAPIAPCLLPQLLRNLCNAKSVIARPSGGAAEALVAAAPAAALGAVLAGAADAHHQTRRGCASLLALAVCGEADASSALNAVCKLLSDANEGVRAAAAASYWEIHSTDAMHAEAALCALDPSRQKLLARHRPARR